MSTETVSPAIDAAAIESYLANLRAVIVAFSGGVDSSVVLAAAQAAKLESLVAVTAHSPSVAGWQLELAKKIASEIGAEHRVIETHEVDDSRYRVNDVDRCFHCKRNLYAELQTIGAAYPDANLVSGTNADDLGDYRPGIEAGNQSGVKTPLADLGITKTRVRAIARHYGLSNNDLPASPCLSSRVAYGVEVTPTRLLRIEKAEDWLRARGFDELRVRHHADELARIEVPKPDVQRVIELDAGGEMSEHFKSLGFRFVTVDLNGFRSGSMNDVLVSIGGRITR